ncbi:Hydroxypyruvate isomerase OS=Streptomyces antimycoticus OX=68175 GN=SANT12839_091240 PE=3 SV=1 [Streptomyces antimycoticus]
MPSATTRSASSSTSTTVRFSEGDITTRLETFLPSIAHLQVADVPGPAEPGSGEMAWDFVFDRLRSTRLRGPDRLASYRPANGTAEGLGWLTRFIHTEEG